MAYNYTFTDEKGAKWKYSSPNQLSVESLEQLSKKAKTAGVFDHRADQAQELKRSDLMSNLPLKDAVRTWYRANNGKDFKGDDNALITEYYRQMRDYDANLENLLFLSGKLLTNAQYDEKARQSLAIMWDTWDKVVPFYQDEGQQWQDAFKDYAVSSLLDKTNWLEFGKAGAAALMGTPVAGAASTAESIARKEAVEQGIKYQIKQAIKKTVGHVAENAVIGKVVKSGAVKAAKAAAKEGAIYGSITNVAEQFGKKSVGQHGDFSLTELGETTLESAAVGGLIGGAAGIAGEGIKAATGALSKSWLGHIVTDSPVYKKFFDKAGETPTTRKLVDLNEARKKFDIDEAEVIKRYNDLTEVAKSDLTGAERKAVRDQHFTIFKDRLTKFMGVDPDVDHYFGSNRISFDDITKSEEVLGSIYDRAGILPNDDIHTISDKILNMDASTVIASKQKIGGKVLNLTGVEQQQATLIAIANHMWDNFRIADEVGDPSINAIKNVDTFIKVIDRVRQTSTMSGRLLQMNRNWFKESASLVDSFKALSPEEKILYSKDASRLTSMDEALHFMDEVSKLQNAALREHGLTTADGNIAWKKLGIKSAKWLEEAYKSAIMNKPSMAMYNMGTALIHAFTMPMEDLLAGLKTHNKQLTQEALLQLSYPFQFWYDLHNSFGYGMRAFLTSRSAFTDRSLAESIANSQYEVLSKDFDFRRVKKFGLFDKRAWMTDGETELLSNPRLGARFIGNGLKFFSKRIAVSTDEFIETSTFRSKALAIATVEEMAKGLSKKDAIKEAIRRTDEAMRDQIIAHMKGTTSSNPLAKTALDTALEATWKANLSGGFDVGYLAKAVQSAKNPKFSVNDSVGKVWAKAYGSLAMNLIVPFVRTPANIINYTLEHTPYLSMLSKKYRTALKSADPMVREVAMTKMSLGAAFWSIAMFQALAGDLQGGGSQDIVQRKTQQGGDEKGRRMVKYSMDLGDGKRLEFTRMDPLFTPHKILADVMDVLRYGTPEQGAGIIATLALQFADTMDSFPTLQGVDKLQNIIRILTANQEEMTMEKRGEKAGKLLSTYLHPMSPTYWATSLMKELLGDKGLEEADNIVSAIKGDIGYMAEKMGFDYNTGLNRIFDPVLSIQLNKDPWNPAFAHQEDTPLNKILNDMRIQPPSSLKNGGKVDLEEVIHSPSGRSYYDYYQSLIGSVKLDQRQTITGFEKFMVGKNLKECLESLVASPEFKDSASINREMTKYQSGKIVIDESPQEQLIRQIINHYRTIADGMVLEEAARLANDRDNPDEAAKEVYNSWISQ